jgi:hypothetical protein
MKLSVEVHSALAQAQQQIFAAHGRDVHFTGCSIGLRRRGGQVTDEPVVVAMVTKKLPAAAVSRSRLLPRSVTINSHACGVDVVEAGPLYLRPQAAAVTSPEKGGPITGKYDPPVMGCSISDNTGTQEVTGTFGCLVRDLSDNKICVLGSNTVLAQNGLVSLGTVILQPSLKDGIGIPGGPVEIATLKHYIPFKTTSTNYVNCATAEIVIQTHYSQGVANNLMPPISATHPTVGMCAFGDDLGNNCFMVPMGATVSALGVELLAGSSCIVTPPINAHIEKVARTSGYTSSTVAGYNAIINVQDNDTGQTLVFGNMIWTQGFFIPGDSGAVACVGGNGRTFVPPPSAPCPLLAGVGNYYNLPLQNDNTLTDQIKTEFLAQSLIGNLIIGLIYLNADTAIDRVEGKTAGSIEQAYANQYYNKYLPLAQSAVADPDSTTLVVTKDNLNDFQFILSGLAGAGGAPPLLTGPEANALQTIYNEVLTNTVGMDFAQLVTYMNDGTVYQKVIKAFTGVPTIQLIGTIGEDGLR